MPPVPCDYYKIYKGSTVTISPQFFVDARLVAQPLNEIFLTLFGTSVFLSGHHQELVLGPHPEEGTDVSPALLRHVVQEVWGFQILAWCMRITGV
jgi:hypothetical protein